MKESKLKPCPFCGGEAKTYKRYHYGLGYEYWVECTVCGIHTPGGIGNEESVEIKLWNRRTKS